MKQMTKPTESVAFTFCKNFASAETKKAAWPVFVASVSRSVEYPTKAASIKRESIVGGVRDDEKRGRADNVRTRTIATLDYDDLPGVTLADIELQLEVMLAGCAWVAYSTYRHTPEAPRIRVFVPLSRAVGKAEYEALVDLIADDLGLGDPDSCSKVMAQIFFMASHQPGVAPWSASGDGAFMDVGPIGERPREEVDNRAEHMDLASIVAAQPLDLTEGDIDALLEANPAEGLDYEDWLKTGMALAHQYQGSEAGYGRWAVWSAKSVKHDVSHMKTKWRSFRGTASPVTMRSLIKASPGVVSTPSSEIAVDSVVTGALDDEADRVCDAESWALFKTRIQGLTDAALPPDRRGMLASVVHMRWGKGAGLTLTEVKKALKRPKAERMGETLPCPAWLDGWAFAEAEGLFVNLDVDDYAIRRESFRAKYDRQVEVVAQETDAATFALNLVQIPTVVRGMYWPGMDRLFEYAGKPCYNTYGEDGQVAAETLKGDADGQAVVDLFLRHLDNLIESERERGLLLDWMSYVYRNPGARVRWGMLLWGIEGNGKSYIFHVLQRLMGRNARVITTSMIEGRFNDWAVGSRLIGIEEVRIAGTNKYKILDQLKPMISNDTIGVEPKGQASYLAPNFASYLMTTNHIDAVPMSANDRRYCVIFTRQRTQDDLFALHGGRVETEQYFETLFSETERRVDAIGRFLLDRVMGAEFKASGRAPVTSGLAEMRAANVGDDEQALMDAMEDHACEVISDDLIDVTWLNITTLADGVQLPQGRALGRLLMDRGMAKAGRIRVGETHHMVWYKPGQDKSVSCPKDRVRAWHMARKASK